MNFIIWIIVGGILGWLASLVMGTDRQQGLLLNIIVGIVGAFLAGLVLTPILGIGTINQSDFSLPGLIVSFLGALGLLAIINLFRRGTVR
ncbi:MAG TPA: GlsB/YeaQ/YmgE family stress response membrane protein [Chloroflexota bacterium]|nr:GlsB/YeaQ/YmgE family stress response membrane protein [Chloroflexota bacterium]HUM67940.1 GlsB/YeaQ/YmgE family stress response membrane protein [Chloroflexota bacterium]